MAINVTYPTIVPLIGGDDMTVQQQSRQLLVWYLLNYERLDETEALDSVCDKPGDQGIDGLLVNDNVGEINVLSSVLKTQGGGLGDKDLKNLYASMVQLRTGDGVRQIIANTPNAELRTLLEKNDIAVKVENGYTIRGTLVSNGHREQDAINYLNLISDLDLVDGQRLIDEYIEIDEVLAINTPVTFNTTGKDRIVHLIDGKPMLIVTLSAEELLGMDGIVNEKLFAPNVRQWLGKNTSVNRELAQSIGDPNEHKLFPAFHNGLTVLCGTLTIEENSFTIDGYGVANGCQSLRGFKEKELVLTPDLQVLVRFINEPPNTPLAAIITNRTNNQNGISSRDLKANHPLQTRLQTEINAKYVDEIYFRVKRGEHPEWQKDKVLENLLAGRILLAFNRKRPDAAHQGYKVFEDFYAEIFRGVTGDRVVVLYDLYNDIMSKVDLIEDKLIAHYTQTGFIILDFVRAVLETSAEGRRFIENPNEFLDQPSGRERLKHVLGEIATTVFRLFNAEINRRKQPAADGAETFFDYKREFKSAGFINNVRETVKSQYQITIDGKFLKPFVELWSDSEPGVAAI